MFLPDINYEFNLCMGLCGIYQERFSLDLYPAGRMRAV
jgi:hypothetical protein